MFNNLIESNSHRHEFKRRGSFLLFTTASYAMVLAISGVVSIYAYDAHLQAQATQLELLTYVPLQDVSEPKPQPPRNTIGSPTSSSSVTRSSRTTLIDSVTNPNNAPRNVGTVAPNVPPARPDSIIGPTNTDPIGPSNMRSNGNGEGTPLIGIDVPEPPPVRTTTSPVPVATAKIVRSSRVLNSKALFLPKPVYSMLAKQIKAQGTVVVQVLIDERGNVISAKAISGHPLLLVEAQRAALQARFSPTILGETPVKVSGIITYNFVMQ